MFPCVSAVTAWMTDAWRRIAGTAEPPGRCRGRRSSGYRAPEDFGAEHAEHGLEGQFRDSRAEPAHEQGLDVLEASRRNGVSEQSVHNWKRLFLESGREGQEKGTRRPFSREMELEAENEELKATLGEAHVQLRVWK